VEQVEFPQALERIVGGSRCCGCLQEDDEVAYAQQQNGCFKSEYSSLARDADAHIPWATEALGCMPEAVNLWIGNQRSVTSFHKDHYENLYAVVTGEKHFTLLPPTDLHRMYIRSYPSAHYVRGRSSELVIEEDRPTAMVPWVSVDPFPLPSDRKEAESKYPLYFDGPKPFSCTVRAGELLYLPSMWFHHVRQTPDPKGPTIALNYCMFFLVFCLLEKKIHCSEEFACEDQMQRKIDGEFVSVCCCECNNLSHSHSSAFSFTATR
jgi:jumonji domain-containing protein 7